MTQHRCLDEKELQLFYYAEADSHASLARIENHLAECHQCRSQFDRLAADLQLLPVAKLRLEPCDALRLSAKVVDRLSRRRTFKPVWGGALTAMVLFILFVQWTTEPRPAEQATLQSHTGSAQESFPEVDLLENLDLLEELETLRDLEGV